MFHKKRDDIFIRTVAWPIKVDDATVEVLRKISDHHWQLWSDAIGERQSAFDENLAPLYAQMRVAKERNDPAEVKRIKTALAEAFKRHMPDAVSQINSLTPRRARDREFARMPRNWQEETIKIVDGAYKSFMALRKAGDMDARPPQIRSEWDFCEVRGRSGFKVKGHELVLSLGGFAGHDTLTFRVNSYQRAQLAHASDKGRLKSFSLYRKPRDLREKGAFWLSVTFDLPRPQAEQFDPKKAVYIALGASHLGVVSPQGEEVVHLWRPDFYWKPEIENVFVQRGVATSSDPSTLIPVTKGSRRWRRRNAARQKKFRKMSGLQRHDRRNIPHELMSEHGVHFVVSEVVVRSKEGKLADGSKPERGGSLGLNWSAQNTGSFQLLVAQLTEKAKECGGSVREYRLPRSSVPQGFGKAGENKIAMARALRESFLSSLG